MKIITIGEERTATADAERRTGFFEKRDVLTLSAAYPLLFAIWRIVEDLVKYRIKYQMLCRIDAGLSGWYHMGIR